MPDKVHESFHTYLHKPQAISLERAGVLVLVSTPIGNLRDITARAIAELEGADEVLCEDTRRTAKLLSGIGLKARLRTLNDHNEEQRIAYVLRRLHDGSRIALVSDAGTPLVSDPGFRLVRATIAARCAVEAIPGPNAALTALILSGLPPFPFLFMGFTPPRQQARRTMLGRVLAAENAGLRATLVWHEAPHRLADSLGDIADVLGDRSAAVARELTKRFEEVRRDSLRALSSYYYDNLAQGEITLVVSPMPDILVGDEVLDDQLRSALPGRSLRDAASIVASATGVSRKLVYARALSLQDKGS